MYLYCGEVQVTYLQLLYCLPFLSGGLWLIFWPSRVVFERVLVLWLMYALISLVAFVAVAIFGYVGM